MRPPPSYSVVWAVAIGRSCSREAERHLAAMVSPDLNARFLQSLIDVGRFKYACGGRKPIKALAPRASVKPPIEESMFDAAATHRPFCRVHGHCQPDVLRGGPSTATPKTIGPTSSTAVSVLVLPASSMNFRDFEESTVVLQERIELSTSPLPRECSTTELLQHPRVSKPKKRAASAIGAAATQAAAWAGWAGCRLAPARGSAQFGDSLLIDEAAML